ncbi:hypothetical protein GW17_00051268 [Ensete ventricosum]|nr:hypothetical protein GW17_00051268 [Ensete ventricosum]
MAVSSTIYPACFVSAAAGDRRTSDSGAPPRPEKLGSSSFLLGGAPRFSGLSSATILRFPPNFVRQLSTKARRNCSNIGVAQIVAASWSNSSQSFEAPRSAASADAVVAPEVAAEDANLGACGGSESRFVESPVGEAKVSAAVAKAAASLSSDGSLAVHAGDRSISALERAESTLFVASGMYASVAMLSSLVPAGGHIVITTDCYRKTRIFIENELPKMGISGSGLLFRAVGAKPLSTMRSMCRFVFKCVLQKPVYFFSVIVFQVGCSMDLSGSERAAKYGIKDNLVRFSFGVEGFEDLKADILQALEKI